MPLDLEKLREMRKKKGLSQEAAAEAAQLGSKQRWNNIEKGRETNLTLDVLERIAAVLGVRARELIK